jgi:predicted transcriptional regulator
MVTAPKSLMALTAADLMSEALVLIPHEMSLQAAARLLSHQQISGAPVVDNQGVCVGVLSAMDFVHWAEKSNSAARPRSCLCESFANSWQIMAPDALPADAVANYMTPGPVTVATNVRVAELARMMLDAHIHRVIVVDTHGHPRGVVSSTDILAALAYADPEAGLPKLKKGADA